MIQSGKTKRFVWILSLVIGPVAYCILLLAIPGTPDIEAIKENLIDIVGALAVFWVVGFVFVWAVYWLSKFMVKYGPFM